jgi:preprotein translocase subunit SecG
MAKFLLVIHIMVAFSMIVLILLQRSEGGALGMGGGGGGGFVTGRGAANLLTRTTAILAAIFFTTSLALGIFSHKPAPTSAVGLPVPAQESPAPAPAGEQAPASLPSLSLQKLKPQTPPVQNPAPAAPVQPQLPQSQ